MSTPVRVVRTIDELGAAAGGVRARGGRLGLVPTMGALHEGHAALMQEAARLASSVVVTIFVNPTQFGPKEDIARYPRDLEGDVARCAAEGVALVFAPEVAEMYPEGERTRVRVSGLTDHLCGASRPGHFEGVATIVTKLFAAVGPAVAVFGRKDYQQLQVIRRMARDLFLPIEVVGYPTVREPDGLALSSRNRYLAPDDRRRALAIPRGLAGAVRLFADGERRAGALVAPVARGITEAGLRVDYVDVAHADDLSPYGEEERVPGRALVAVAAFAGTTRLIDNVVLGEDPAPRGGRMTPLRGRFIVLEGIDGSGTTTQARLLASSLEARGVRVLLTCEPTPGPVGVLIRQALKRALPAPEGEGPRALSWAAMALLFAADRVDHLDTAVIPALEAGHTVVSDRYVLSSLAYQSVTSPEGARSVPWIRELNARAIPPDLTLVLDVDEAVAAERRAARGGPPELFEVREIQKRLAEVYARAEELVSGVCVHVPDGPPDEVAACVLGAVLGP